jgi:hypothetical protein
MGTSVSSNNGVCATKALLPRQSATIVGKKISGCPKYLHSHCLTCTYKRPVRPPWLDTSVELGHVKQENELCISSAACSSNVGEPSLSSLTVEPLPSPAKLQARAQARTRTARTRRRQVPPRRRTSEPRLPRLPSPSPLDHHLCRRN